MGPDKMSGEACEHRTTGPAGELMLAIAAWDREAGAFKDLERTKAGLARGRRQGKVPGKPKRVIRRDEVVRLRDVERMSWRAIAAALDIPVITAVDAYRHTEMVVPSEHTSDSGLPW
jgi:DNA invertase Pin-like site-specific DNA recombinase